jgi:hypothetical protein
MTTDRELALEWAEKEYPGGPGWVPVGPARAFGAEGFLAGLAAGRAGERETWLAGLVRETGRTEQSDRFAVGSPGEYDPVFFPTREMAEEFAAKWWRKEQP